MSVNLENVKLWMHPSLMMGCKLHQDAVTFYVHLAVFNQGKFLIWSGKRQGILNSNIRTNPE